jgi:hypothetical protein
VHLSAQEWRPFIGGRGSTKDGLGRPGHRACRLWEGQGVALARRGHVRRCCGDVGDAMAQQGDEGEREEQWPEVGGSGCFSFFLLSLKAGVRAGETGGRQRGERGCPRVWLGHLGRTAVALLQWVWFSEFLPRTCSTQCPHEIKF